jgi:hypothetical protein
MPELTANAFVAALTELQADVELEKIQRYFKSGEGDYGEGDEFLGVRMRDVFALAKRSTRPRSSSVAATSSRPSGSPRCSPAMSTSWSRRPSGAGYARPASTIARGC